MTYDDMLAEAGRIAEALRSKGYDAAVNTEDVQPGDPIPIFYSSPQDGTEFVLELNVL